MTDHIDLPFNTQAVCNAACPFLDPKSNEVLHPMTLPLLLWACAIAGHKHYQMLRSASILLSSGPLLRSLTCRDLSIAAWAMAKLG